MKADCECPLYNKMVCRPVFVFALLHVSNICLEFGNSTSISLFIQQFPYEIAGFCVDKKTVFLYTLKIECFDNQTNWRDR